MFTARRKEAYEAIHGSARGNRAKAAADARWGGEDDASDQVDHKHKVPTFEADTAKKTGRSEVSIRRNAERGTKIDAEVLASITGTHLDSGAYMDALKGLTKPEQRDQQGLNLAVIANLRGAFWTSDIGKARR